MSETPSTPRNTFTTFWVMRSAGESRTWPGDQRTAACRSAVDIIDAHRGRVALRAAYSTMGLTAGVDLIIWLVADDVAAFQQLSAELNRSPMGPALEAKFAYLGMASSSQYNPEHGPAFLRGIPPRKYLSVYPFTKTPAWYLLPFEKRRELMSVHGQLGEEFPSILTNTVSSFGIADQEFVVALEDDDPAVLIKMVQRLRGAEVREYTQVDTPIFLGLRKELGEVLMDALG
jgi:hydrogen peroxide-dependent heme synthase